MKRSLLLILFVGLTACGQYVAYDGEQPTPPTSSTLEDFPETKTLNHITLSGLMAQFVTATDDGLYVYIDYRAIANDPESTYMLNFYMATVASVNPSALETPEDRQAYWYNAYNAAVIQGVLREFNQNVGFKVIDNGSFFNDPFFTFGKTALSLNQLEQGVLRGKFDHENVKIVDAATLEQIKTWHKEVWKDGKVDARLHAALNCGALGCPNLLKDSPFVWQAKSIDEDLDKITTQWVNNPEKGAGPNGVSNLFEWYKQDFVDSEGSVKAFIEKYRTGGAQDVKLDTIITYDWTLNAPENGTK